jgi:hypothetical protein
MISIVSDSDSLTLERDPCILLIRILIFAVAESGSDPDPGQDFVLENCFKKFKKFDQKPSCIST